MPGKLLKFILPVFLALMLLAGGCGGSSEPSDSPPPHRVESIRLDDPTPVPDGGDDAVEVYDTLDDAARLADYCRWYVDPLLPIHSGWRAAEDIGAEEFGQFYVLLGDDRRGYPIDQYLSESEDVYRVPDDMFCATLRQYFEVDVGYLKSFPLYDGEEDTFVLPAEMYVGFAAEVYRAEESETELRLRYILYAANQSAAYFENTGSLYELLIKKDETGARWVSSVPVTDDGTIPAPQNGSLYLNTEITSFYTRRGMTVEDSRDVGNLRLVSYSGQWSGLELFDRTTGAATPIAYMSVGENGRPVLLSPPFGDFEAAQLAAFELREGGEVWMQVRGLTDEVGEVLPPQLYVWSNGTYRSEEYCVPLGGSTSFGGSSRGTLYDLVTGEGSAAFIFDTGGAAPQIRSVSGSGSVTLYFSGVTLTEEEPAFLGASTGLYTVTTVRQSGTETSVTFSIAPEVKRYRIVAHEPLAGRLPYYELDFVTSELDYPSGW